MAERAPNFKLLLSLIDSSDDDDMDMEGQMLLRRVVDAVSEVASDDADANAALAGALECLRRNSLSKNEDYFEVTVPSYTDEQFISHFRLQRSLVKSLAQRFQETQTFQSLLGHGGFVPISPEKHMLSFLWMAGHQTSGFRDVADRFNMSLSGLHGVVTRIIDFLLSIRKEVIRPPTNVEKEATKNYYLQKKGFPGVIGSIDGSHIRIDKPSDDPDAYCNRKRYFSLHLQGVADHRRKFFDVLCGWPGSVHDARVFSNSTAKGSLQGICGQNYYILGDSAYPCLPYLMTPYRDNGHLTRAQKLYNRTLSSCRISIEHAFGLLKQRFRQLYFLRWRSTERMVEFIIACCVLHNLADEEDLQCLNEQPEEDDFEDPTALVNIRFNHTDEDPEDDLQGKDIRDEICRQVTGRQS